MTKKDEKVFVIINSYLVGDMLLVNSLAQNIKRIYQNSKVVMLTNKTFYDLSKYQKDIDDVIIWDRHGEHKGFMGMLKFIKNFPYKKVFASFPIYGTDRPIMLGYMLGSKYNLFVGKKNIFKFLQKTKYKIQKESPKVQTQHMDLLKGITKEELIDCPIKYYIDDKTTSPIENTNEYIVLCPISSKRIKDMPYETIVELIKNLNKKVVILGNGQVSRELSEKLKQENLENLIDLTDKTSLQQAAKVMDEANGVISVDTGLMHMSCALNKPTVAVFYQGEESGFAPNEKMYNAKSIFKNQSCDNIIKILNELINKGNLDG